MNLESYYELVFKDGRRQKLDGVGTLESAKATAVSVASVTGETVELNKVQPIDPKAPPQRRGTSSEG